MKKLPFIILLAALSGLHLSACAEEDAAKQETTVDAKPAEGEQATAPTDETKPAGEEQATASADETKPAGGEQATASTDEAKTGEKKAGGGEEPDCN